MKNINNGQPIILDYTKMSSQEQIKYATAFAEGSDALKNILLLLWRNGINTYSSCAGHPDQGPLDCPYIALNTKDMTNKQIQTVLSIALYMPSFKSVRFKLFYTEDADNSMIDKFTKQPCSRNSLSLRWFNNMQALEHFYAQLAKEWNKPLIARKLSNTQIDLINNICTLKDVNIKAVDLSYYKKYYKHLPNTVNTAMMHYYKADDKFELSLKYYTFLHKLVTRELKCTPISYAYNPETNRRYMVVDGKVKMVSRQVAEQFLSMQEYEDLIKEHFTKDLKTFTNALTGNH